MSDREDSGPTLSYPEVRASIRDGDVLCFRGNASLSKLIMKLSGGSFSHTAIAFWWGQSLMALQVEVPGVQVVPVSRAVGSYDGNVEWFALKEEYRTPERIDKLRQVAQNSLGDRYSVLDLFLVGLHYAVGTQLPNPNRSSLEFICAHYVAHCYSTVGLDLAPNRAHLATTPEDLARSPLLVRQGVLRAPTAR